MQKNHIADGYNADTSDRAPVNTANAITRIFCDNEKILHKIVVKMIGDNDTASDIVQAAFVKVWNYSKLQTVDHPRALFFKAARNLAKDELRRRSRHRDQNIFADDPLEIAEFRQLPSQEKSPEEIMLLRQEASAILKAIEKLPLRNRRAFKQHRFHGLTYQEISRKMDVSQSSVEKYIIEALKQLRHYQRVS